MSKENTPSHADQTLWRVGEKQAVVHSEFLGGVAGGGKLGEDAPKLANQPALKRCRRDRRVRLGALVRH